MRGPTYSELAVQLEHLVGLVQDIKDALGTDENGDALIEVARNAHRVEMELAARIYDEQQQL